jgi:hypothetical protein
LIAVVEYMQQGDPLGPLGFALALHLVIKKILRRGSMSHHQQLVLIWTMELSVDLLLTSSKLSLLLKSWVPIGVSLSIVTNHYCISRRWIILWIILYHLIFQLWEMAQLLGSPIGPDDFLFVTPMCVAVLISYNFAPQLRELSAGNHFIEVMSRFSDDLLLPSYTCPPSLFREKPPLYNFDSLIRDSL